MINEAQNKDIKQEMIYETHPMTTAACTEVFNASSPSDARCSMSSTSNPELDVFSV